MDVIQSLLHYGSYAVAFYALYLVAGSLAFGLYVWLRVFRQPELKPVPVRVRRNLRDSDTPLR